MPLARLNTTSFSIGLFASVLGLGTLLASPVDARTRYLPQRTQGQQFPAFTQWSYGTPGVYRNTPPGVLLHGRMPRPCQAYFRE